MFVCFEAKHSSQQFFSHVGTDHPYSNDALALREHFPSKLDISTANRLDYIGEKYNMCRPFLNGAMKSVLLLFDHLAFIIHSVFNIMITCPCNVYPLTAHLYIVKLGFTGGGVLFFYFWSKT